MRDYSMTGADAQQAIASGLAAAEWYHSATDRQAMKALMRRSDQPALRDSAVLLGVMLISAAGGVYFWGSWWCLPCWLVYGVLYGSAMDSRWHECGHGTAFKSQWLNQCHYQIASFCMMRNPAVWRWSHSRHHSNTIIVGRDPEIAVMRPPQLARLLLNFFGLPDVYQALRSMLRYATGKLDADIQDYVPATEHNKICAVARIWLLMYLSTGIAAWQLQSILPFMLIGLPRMYGAWHHVMTGLLQHGGLAENVVDHRLNTRTVYMNPISRFIYWNMNYHVEHHMFPMVPYHALPKLHQLIKHDLPAPNPSIYSAMREMWPALWQQLRYQDYFLKRELPPSAQPYRLDFQPYVPSAS